MTHAWLFTGPPGSGRSVAARAFAAALQCPDGGDGTCHACRTVLAGTHADVHVVVPDGLSIGAAEARELVRVAGRAPSQGRWQVILVEDADRMTEQASNAVLKMIEEPPPRTVVMLCAPQPAPRRRAGDHPLPLPGGRAAHAAGGGDRRRARQPGRRRPGAGRLVGRGGRWARRSGPPPGPRRGRPAGPQGGARRPAVAGLAGSLPGRGRRPGRRGAGGGRRRDRGARRRRDRGREGQPRRRRPGPGVAAASRGAGQLKELERKQKSRATRLGRDSLDRALVDLAGLYRDALVLDSAAGTRRSSTTPTAGPTRTSWPAGSVPRGRCGGSTRCCVPAGARAEREAADRAGGVDRRAAAARLSGPALRGTGRRCRTLFRHVRRLSSVGRASHS